jgi:aryl-alcohol dehydrogenase-like predicted oxidoreductase
MTFTDQDRSLAGLAKVGGALADELVGRALEAGVTFFDTADSYSGGESERLLAKALGSRRDDVVLATKVGFRTGESLGRSGLSRRHILWSIDESLRRLGTDWLDVYIAHREDPWTPLEETLGVLDELVRSGKVRYLGFSNWSAWKVAAAVEIQRARGFAEFTHGQMQYSLLGRDVERDVIPMMRRYGLGLTVWSPLSFGFLSGKYTLETLADPANRFSAMDIRPFDKGKGFELVERMREIGAGHGASVAQVAIAWLLSKESVSSVLLGASKLGQLEDNLGSADVRLTPEELAVLDDMTVPAPVYPNWYIAAFEDAATAEALARPTLG